MRCAPPLSWNIPNTNSLYYGTFGLEQHHESSYDCFMYVAQEHHNDLCEDASSTFKISNPGSNHPKFETASTTALSGGQMLYSLLLQRRSTNLLQVLMGQVRVHYSNVWYWHPSVGQGTTNPPSANFGVRHRASARPLYAAYLRYAFRM